MGRKHDGLFMPHRRWRRKAFTAFTKAAKAMAGVDVDGYATMDATGAIRFNESDLKYNEVVEKFSARCSRRQNSEFYDAISGEVEDSELIKMKREAERETFKKHGVYG